MNSNLSDSPVETSIWTRMFNMLAAPGEVFDELRQSPPRTVNWLLPLVLNCLAGLIFIVVAFSQPAVVDDIIEQQGKAFDKAVEQGKMTEADADKARQGVEQARPIIRTMGTVFGSLGMVVVNVLMVFVGALIMWPIGAKALGAPHGYLKYVELVALTGVINVLGTLVTMFLAVMKGTMSVSASPVVLMGDLSPQSPLFAALSMLNVFFLWGTALTALGLAKYSGRSFAQAAAWCFGLYFLIGAAVVGVAVLRN